jgi:GT2 family glycosyltransferase
MLHDSVLCLVEQTVPCRIVISVPTKEHLSPKTLALPSVELVLGAVGLCAQRNAAMRHIDDTLGTIFFFDDDVEIERHYVEEMLRLFEERPGVMLANGDNVGFGAIPGTLTREIARELIRSQQYNDPARGSSEPSHGGLGCMMCFRASLLRKVQFDERLALYGYLEDLDFSLQCGQHGELVTNRRCLMVHIETTQGRIGCRRRGYSEVVNPIYIWSKGTGAKITRSFAGAVKRTLKNLLRCHTRGGRDQFLGNLTGWRRLAAGKIEPEYILRIND